MEDCQITSFLVLIFFLVLISTVDCQLGPWTSCNTGCGLAGKTRFFGRRPAIEQKGDKCTQGDTWQKCGNLPQCEGDHLTTIPVVVGVSGSSSLLKLKTCSLYHENLLLQKFNEMIAQVLK